MGGHYTGQTLQPTIDMETIIELYISFLFKKSIADKNSFTTCTCISSTSYIEYEALNILETIIKPIQLFNIYTVPFSTDMSSSNIVDFQITKIAKCSIDGVRLVSICLNCLFVARILEI